MTKPGRPPGAFRPVVYDAVVATRAVKLWNEGLTADVIRQRLGMTRATLHHVLKRAGSAVTRPVARGKPRHPQD